MATFTVTAEATASLQLVENQASHIANVTVSNNGFSKPIALDVNPFKVGDRFLIPEKHKVFKVKIGNGLDEYCFVPVLEQGETEIVTKQFRPSALTKRVHEVDPNDLSFLGWVRAEGTVVDLYRTGTDAEDGIKKVIAYGKENKMLCEVTEIKTPTRFLYGSNTETEETPVLKVDFVEDK